MKWLIGISAVQTCLLAALGLRIETIGMRADDIAQSAEQAKYAAENMSSRVETQAVPSYTIDENALSADEVRMIMRQEIAALAKSMNGGPALQPVKVERRSAEEIRQLQNSYQQQFAMYLNAGAATQGELEGLFDTIAKLPTSQRRRAMSEVSGAINSGQIDGHL